MNSKTQTKNTVKIASRTSVQSEPVVSSDGVPSLKYAPVVLYPEKDDINGNKVFSLEEDNLSAKDISVSPEDDKGIEKDMVSSEEEKMHAPDKNASSVEPKTMIRWRRLDKESVKAEMESMEKTKGLECGFCEQEQVNPKLLPCFHSFCRECLQKLVCIHNGRHWIKCPLCKKKVNLLSKSLTGVEDNIYMKLPNASPQSDDKVCEMCQLQVPTYICSECQTDLCTDCVGKHLTSLRARDHSIKNLPERKVETDSEAVCEIHKPFTLELFCNTCSEPICGRCAINKHLNHVTEDIAVGASEKRKSLTGMLNDNVTTRILRILRDNLVSNRKEKARLRVEITKITDEIKQYMDKLKADIDKMGLKLIEELKGNEVVWLSSLDRKFQEAESRQRSAEQILTTARRIIDNARDVDFIRKYGPLRTAVQFVKKISQPALQSVSCQFIPLSKPGLFGRVKMNASLTRAIEFYDIGKASFQKRIYSICGTSDSSAWIGYGKTLQLCQKDGKLGIKIELDDMILSIAENSYETVFVACKSAVKVIGSKMNVKTCFHLPHEPTSIAFNEEDNLIICYKEARRISIHSTKGKVIKELDVRHFGYRFGARITDPWRIAVNENQDILVADYSSENIAVFDSLGDIKSTFRCSVFRRAILCCDQGLVYVADQRKDQVYVFSEMGQLLQTIRAEGISGLWSMNIDRAGNLWLGSLHGAVKIYGRK